MALLVTASPRMARGEEMAGESPACSAAAHSLSGSSRRQQHSCGGPGCGKCLKPLVAALAQQQTAAALVRQPRLRHMHEAAGSGGGAAADCGSSRLRHGETVDTRPP